MTFKQKTTQERQDLFDISACIAMMEKMMGGHMEGCDCEEMLSLFSDKDVVHDVQKMMSQMESCCGIGKEDESASN